MSKVGYKWVLLAVLAASGAAAAILILPTGRAIPQMDEQKLQKVHDLYAEYSKSFPNVPEMTVAQLLDACEDDNLVLLDVREPKEQEVSMIPGAIPAALYEREPGKYETKRIVAYCTIGYRSGQYAKRLLKQGKKAWNLEGGILAWVHAGQPVVHKGEQTRSVHVYGSKWDLLPKGWDSVK